MKSPDGKFKKVITTIKRHGFFRSRINRLGGKPIERYLSQQIDITGVHTVCLAMGPYRNLTTLAASLVALHPRCQVLNHGGDRILGDKKLNFFLDYGNKKFDAFVKYAIYASKGGMGGSYGGSILFSHAFDSKYKVKEIYKKRFGNSLNKKKVNCLFWKEPLKISQFIRQNKVGLSEIFSCNDKLKFLMPVRNPLDCASSTLKKRYAHRYVNLNKKIFFGKNFNNNF